MNDKNYRELTCSSFKFDPRATKVFLIYEKYMVALEKPDEKSLEIFHRLVENCNPIEFLLSELKTELGDNILVSPVSAQTYVERFNF